MRYPDKMKQRVGEVFIATGDIHQAHQTIIDEYSGQYDRLPTLSTITQWLKDRQLMDVRDNIYVDTIKDSRARQLEEQVQRREFQRSTMQQVYDAGMDGVIGPNAKPFKNPLDATRAAEIAYNIERKLTDEEINLKFVEDVLSVVDKVIKDDEIKRDIGIELRKVLIRHSS